MNLESIALNRIKREGYPAPWPHYRFHPVRRFEFDLAWPDIKLAVELEGGVFIRGRHSRGVGYTNDCTKYNLAVLNGWRVLRYTTKNIDDLCRDLTAIFSGAVNPAKSI